MTNRNEQRTIETAEDKPQDYQRPETVRVGTATKLTQGWGLKTADGQSSGWMGYS